MIGAYNDKPFSLWTNAWYATLSGLNLSCLLTIMHISKPHEHYTYETQLDQSKKCKLINSGNASPDSGNKNVGKFHRCIFGRFYNS